ncbi:hypothetical protein C7S20_11910 [Christiangramia fulva]|uniref:TonB C-terminal domain-containing protein n=1 Tax=Christiangramia fulva TaxID=2126553 RepID=A0A2R3Z6L5_9FLAO|nr:hypothetical protein [Christiangramia fulva]AVR45900.1 hypothetical protein C7S20_11910 [Christiangramia fulva]
MKKLQLVFITLALITTSICSASTKPSSDFVSEVKTYLQDLPLEIKHDVSIKVSFSLNEKNEMVVHSVKAPNVFLRKLITKRLDHVKMNASLDSSFEEYTLPVRITP